MGTQTSAAVGVADLTSLLRQVVLDLSAIALPAQNWRRTAGKKQRSGAVIDLSRGAAAGGGKQSSGFGIDVIKVLRELSARIDKLAEHSGTSSSQLSTAANLQSVFASARAGGIDRESLAAIVKTELENAYKGK
jgi:hypothetical protein